MLKILPGTAYLTAFHLADQDADICSVEVTSLSAPPDRYFPPDAIVLPYGGKSKEKIAARLFSTALHSGKRIYEIEVGVDIDRLRVKMLTLESLRTTGMMNLKLVGKCVRAAILEYWCDYLEEEGRDIEWTLAHFGSDVGAMVSSRPDLLGRLAREKEFRHLNMIVFSLFTGGDSVDVGMILNRDAIMQTGCRTDPGLGVILPQAE